MQKLIFPCVLCFLNAIILPAQESPAITTISAFQSYTANHPVEKIYLHSDKPYYAAGETMYFKAYLTDMELNQENVESRIIYVELSNSEKKLVKRNLLYSEENEFAGQMELPDSLPSATYHLRAYTNWMRNAGEDYFYHRDIFVGNITEQKQETTSRPFNYQVDFFPEGGNFLAGLPNKVAFKAMGNDGFGTDITGILTDSESNELHRINSLHFGMGNFSFIPEKGKNYKVFVESKGIQKEYTLPVATEGITILAHQDEKTVYLTILSTSIEPEPVYLIAQSRHLAYPVWEGFTGGESARRIRVDKTKFPTGIVQFTLFKDSQPVSERLIFIDQNDDLQISIIPDKQEYDDREKATIQIKVSDSEGQPVAGNFSLSVTDDKTVIPSVNEQNIKGSLLLDSNLKGYIESPGWYFASDEPERVEALDNLLCTQGWTRFVWDKLDDQPVYQVESEFQITGKVTNLIGGAVKDASVILFSRENMPGKATTDDKGRFGFYGFNCPDTVVFVLQCRTKRDRKTFIGFELDKPDNRHLQSNIFPLTKNDNKGDETILNAYVKQTSSYMKYRMINLPEVTVKAKRKLDHETIGAASHRFQGKILDRKYPIIQMLHFLPKPNRTGPTSFVNKPPRALYDVDGQRMYSEDFETFYSGMMADMFESIDVLRAIDAIALYGLEGSGGVFVLKTKRFTGGQEIPDASIQVYKPEGYSVWKEFYIPAYDKPEVRQDPLPDLRTTIYWNPVIRTDTEGEAEVSFYTADNTGSYSYVLEGMGDSKVAFTKK